MIAHVEGKLAEAWGNSCIVLTAGGTGYRIMLPVQAFNSLPPAGESVAFYTSMAVREDAIELFGFPTFEERQTFEILRGINKVGARTALAVLSVYRPDDLRRIARDGDAAALTRVPGIGQKTAQHVFLELGYRIAALPGAIQASAPAVGSVYADVMAALLNLGYAEQECAEIAHRALQDEPDIDVGSAIRKALKELARRK